MVDIRHMGTRYRKMCPSNQHHDAMKYELLLRSELAMHGNLDHMYFRKPRPSLSLAEFVPRWLREYVKVNNRPCVYDSTYGCLYRNIIPTLGNRPLALIGVPDIDQLKMACLDKGLSPKSINNNLGVLRRCLRSAVEWDLLETVPHIQFMKAPPPKTTYLTPEEARRLVQAAPEGFWRTLIIVALQTGLRASELIGLEWNDIDLERRILLVRRGVVGRHVAAPKNNRIRYVALAEDAVRTLSELPRATERVFPVRDNIVEPYNYIRDGLQRITNDAGLPPIGWHVLRHSFASHLVSAGISLKIVQEALGHSSYEMTLRYAHLAPTTLHEAMKSLPQLDARRSQPLV